MKRSAAVLFALSLPLLACGPARGPDLPRPEAAAFVDALSASWVLVPEESEAPASALSEAGVVSRRNPDNGFLGPRGRAPQPDRGVGGGGGGGDAGPGVPGRGLPGRGQGQGGIGAGGGRDQAPPLDPVAALPLLTGADAFDLVVTDSSIALRPRPAAAGTSPDSLTDQEPAGAERTDRVFGPRGQGGAGPLGRLTPALRVALGPEAPITLVMGAEPTRRSVGGNEMRSSAHWDGVAIRVERTVADGPEIVERWTLSADRSRLVVTRAVDLPRGPELELRRVYRRAVAEP